LKPKNNKSVNLKPLVSIVIPCYNHAQYVQETIQSVIDQDYDNIELIIIDDGSKDNSVEKIQELIPACEKRFVRFEFRHRPNKGLCATLNEAMKWCEGEYFAPLASDDIALPHKTSMQVGFFLTNNDDTVAGVFGRTIPIYSESSAFKADNVKGTAKVTLYNFKDIFLRQSKLPAPTAMLKLAKLKAVDGYDEKIKIEDFYLWLKLTAGGDRLAAIDGVLSLYRRHSGNLSRDFDVMIKGLEQILQLYKNHPDYKHAVARTYLVHAGDCVGYKTSESIQYAFAALKLYPSILFSKAMLALCIRIVVGNKR